MTPRRFLVALGLGLAATACNDAAAPTRDPAFQSVSHPAMSASSSKAQVHPLKQVAGAPKLDAYQLSFWAVKGKSTSVKIKYKDQQSGAKAGGSKFLTFDIPADGLVSKANGLPLGNKDSVQIDLNIDLKTFRVDFQPSGVLFNSSSPAMLQMWFDYADPDLNGDGVVNGTDDALRQQLSIWYTDPKHPWTSLPSQLDLKSNSVSAPVYHFSGYAVSW